MVLAGWQSPGAKRQTQEGVAGWPDFDPDFAEEPGLVEPYLSAIRVRTLFESSADDWSNTRKSALDPSRNRRTCQRGASQEAAGYSRLVLDWSSTGDRLVGSSS